MVGSEKGEKLTPSENFLFWLRFGAIFIYRTARGSEMDPFFVYGSKIDAIKISACLFSEADAHFSYSFLPQQPDQQLIDILGGLVICYQLVPKGHQSRCQQPPFAGAEC